MVHNIDLAAYLFRRLYEAGARAVHGVPGDYNLTALDYLEPAGLAWIGNCNELNAGYAADGYGRIKGIGALITTLGALMPREVPLSTLWEHLHEAFRNKERDCITLSAMVQENLMDVSTAPAQIDRAIIACVRHKRPIYIQLPADMVDAKVPSAPLSTALDFTLEHNDDQMERAAANAIVEQIGGADGEHSRWALRPVGLLRRVLAQLESGALRQYVEYPRQLPNLPALPASLPRVQKTDPLLQDTFWKRISEFFEPGDIIMTETGTPSTGGRDFVLPRQTTLINSGVWLSIGYMLGSSQGVALAQRDLVAEDSSRRGRTILFEGDGSFQMTAQELSTIIHKRLDMIIFLINNDGYTIERLVHGKDAIYNDVAPWRYLEAPSCFGAPNDGSYVTMTVTDGCTGYLKAPVRELLCFGQLEVSNK
ncbi:thiamine diphosphate-binding protein [Fusarium oxysporum f. sp. albedinis]|nr:thiamine diphosphate-binding protein [Fusarium oxysporum f. sp. albedinis]